MSFRIRVIDDPEVNAFSIPGGYVYIYRGLLDKIGNDDDAIACVIGHEASHVVRRHVVKADVGRTGQGVAGGRSHAALALLSGQSGGGRTV